jgi:hypothetical protein
MKVAVSRLTLRLHDNRSLKGKRHVIRSLIDKIRHRFKASVAEVGDQDLLKTGLFRNSRWGLSQLYFAVVWSMIAFGIVVLLVGFVRPLPLIILSASLNAVVMFLYSGMLLWLNVRSFGGPLRPHPIRMGALAFSFCFFGFFSFLTLVDQLS